MRSKTKVAAGVLAGAAAAAAILTAGINHKAAYAVFKNRSRTQNVHSRTFMRVRGKYS